MINSHTIKLYVSLIKPGIVIANTLTAVAGYLFVSGLRIDFTSFIGIISGTVFLIASACVFNNILDISIDSLMNRTLNRPLPSGQISKKFAIYFMVVLFIIACLILILLTNTLTLLIGIIAYICYVFVYGYFKRHSIYGTLVGTVPGSASIVAGGVSYTDHLSQVMIVLGLIMVVWQMAHFYAIAIYRLKDYTKAKLPVWPVVKGIKSTYYQIVVFIFLFLVFNIYLVLIAKVDYVYLVVMFLISIWWLLTTIKTKTKLSQPQWSHLVFINSLKVNLVFIIFVSLYRIIY